MVIGKTSGMSHVHKKSTFSLGSAMMWICKYLLVFIIMYGLNNVSVYTPYFRPFGAGLAVSLMVLGFRGYYLGAIYSITYLLFEANSMGLIHSMCVFILLLILELCRTKSSRRVNIIWMCMGLALCDLSWIIVCLNDLSNILALLVVAIMSQFFMLTSRVFIGAIHSKFRLTSIRIDEKFCGAIMLALFMIGISRVNIGIISIGLIVSASILIFTTFVLPLSYHLVVGIVIGIGYAVSSIDPAYISLFILLALMSSVFKCRIKILSAMALVLTFIIFNLYFNVGIAIGELLSVSIGVVGMMLIPSKYLDNISMRLTNNVHVYRDVEKDIKSSIESRLVYLEKVFTDMAQNYKDMIRGNLDDRDAITLIKDELISTMCAGCSNRKNCIYADNSFVYSAIETFVSIAYQKKKAMLIDVPDALSVNCVSLNSILGYLNNMLITYHEYARSVSDIDSSRLIISGYLNAVGSMIGALHNELCSGEMIDKNRDQDIMETLGYRGVHCIDVQFSYNIDNVAIIVLMVNKNDIHGNNIADIVSKYLKTNFKVSSISDSEMVGYARIKLISMGNYSVVFGTTGISRDGSKFSGDSKSIIEISDGRYMISICDGMGSGEHAKKVSSIALKLIENFYRAGFDSDIILKSVNNLLTLSEDESFSTIDLCVVDTRKNSYDFIKLGSTTSFIRRANGDVEQIDSSNLPVGMVEDISPHSAKKMASPYDMVIMCSDGVTDVLSDREIIDFLHLTDKINPQDISDAIMQHALRNSSGVAHDDMTIVCFRLIENI